MAARGTSFSGVSVLLERVRAPKSAGMKVLLPLAAALLIAAPAAAEDKSIGQQVDEAMQKALKSLEAFVEQFPGYKAPEITPDGDIIIRKSRPSAERDAPEDPDRRNI